MENTIVVKHRSGLAPKLIIGIVIITLLVSAASVVIGASMYWRDITTHYNTVALQTAKAVEGVLDMSDLREWGDVAKRFAYGQATEDEAAAITGSKKYQEIVRLTSNLGKSMAVNDIYVVIYDVDILDDYTPEKFDNNEWTPFIYIIDTYVDPDWRFELGMTSVCDPDFRYMMRDYYLNGEDPPISSPIITYFTDKYILNGMHMIHDGSAVAMIGVEMPLPTLESDMNNFIMNIVIVDLSVLVLVLIFTVILLVVLLIRPIKTASAEAERFVGDNTAISEVLGKIKTHDEIQTLSESLLSLEYGVREYIENLTRVTAERERIGAELNVATKIQADMMRTEFPKRDDLELYASMTPAKEVGGDFYDFFMLDEDHIALVMADVSGKGVPASLFMVIAKTLIEDRTRLGVSPAKIFQEVNNRLCFNNTSNLFVTAWLGILTLSTGDLNYVNAGHEYPAIKHVSGSFEIITSDNYPPLATFEDMEYLDEHTTLSRGDMLFLYTDGVPIITL